MKIQFKYAGEALILAIGLFLAGGAIKNGIVQFKEMDRTVTAKGLSEKEVKADKVTWPLKFKELGNDPAVLYETIAKDSATNTYNVQNIALILALFRISTTFSLFLFSIVASPY